MKKQNQSKFSGRLRVICVLSMLLLIGQFAAIVHSVEHPFHAQDQSCQIFFLCEKSGNGLIAHNLQPPVFVSHTLPSVQIVTVWLSLPQTVFHIRAPPSFS